MKFALINLCDSIDIIGIILRVLLQFITARPGHRPPLINNRL